jgi:hypothetical protein
MRALKGARTGATRICLPLREARRRRKCRTRQAATLVTTRAARIRGRPHGVRDLLDSVHGLDNMMRVAEEMVIACTLIIEREAGAEEARYVLKTAGRVL